MEIRSAMFVWGCSSKVFWKGGGLEGFTDDDGHAEFETSDDYEDSRQLTIYVHGQSCGPYSIGDGRWTVQLD